MANTITYPDGGYGIMPNDAFNKYIRFQNQRRATTGGGASPADTQAFWSGTMDAVVKNSAQRAAQNLENRRLDATVNYQNSMIGLEGRKIDQTDAARKSQMMSGLAQYPMTYLMYDALGVGRRNPVTGKIEGESVAGGALDWTGNLVKSLFGYGKKPIEGSPIPSQSPLQFADSQMVPRGIQGMEGFGSGVERMSDTPGGGWPGYNLNSFLPSGAGDAASYIPPPGYGNEYYPLSDLGTSDMVNIDNSGMDYGFDWSQMEWGGLY